MKLTRFRDRSHAGQLLGQALMKYAHRDDVIVLGLPRGGVPVAYEVAKALQAPLDVMIVRKLGVPGWDELAMGAIASRGLQVLNQEVIRHLKLTPDIIEEVAAVQRKELQRRERAYRGQATAPDVTGKIVIIVDDGIATGSTIKAAVKALRTQAPRRLVIAVPTAASDSKFALEGLVDDFDALIAPDDFHAVGQWYDDFTQTTDEEVTELLQLAQGLGEHRMAQASTCQP